MKAADWLVDDLARYSTTEEIEISTRRADGSLRDFVPIWSVAVDGALYVRSYRGVGGAWYRHASAYPTGVIRAGGKQTDVTFAAAGDDVREAVDVAYRAKYARYGDSFLQPMLADQAAAATLRLNPAN